MAFMELLKRKVVKKVKVTKILVFFIGFPIDPFTWTINM